MSDGPYRGFVELPRAVFDALHESLVAVVEHTLKEQERTRVTPRRPLLLDIMESGPVGEIWREVAPKAQLEWYRLADRFETGASARCICGSRKAEIAVSDMVLEDCHRNVVGEVVARILEHLARGVSNCHCVIREPALLELPPGPTVIEAASCSDCPLAAELPSGYGCHADPKHRSTFYHEDISRPSWCPLDKGPVLVQVRKS